MRNRNLVGVQPPLLLSKRFALWLLAFGVGCVLFGAILASTPPWRSAMSSLCNGWHSLVDQFSRVHITVQFGSLGYWWERLPSQKRGFPSSALFPRARLSYPDSQPMELPIRLKMDSCGPYQQNTSLRGHSSESLGNSSAGYSCSPKKGDWKVQDKRIWKLIQSANISSKPYYLASCVRITNEESFMYEWLVHCLLNGFNHVYVYDNSMMGFDAREALQPFIDIGYVTYINRSADVMQSHPFYLNKSQSYSPPQPIHLQWLSDECVQTYRQEMVWFVTTDVDEFWIAPIGINLAQYLRMIEPNTDALSVSWRLMRPLGLWSVSDTRVRSQVYTEQCSKASTRGAVNCNHRKMIAKAAMVHHFDAPDEPVLVVGARHRFLGCGGQVEYIHYYYKTFEEMLSKRHRGWSLLLKKGRRPEHAEVIDPGIVYCSYNLSEPNPKLAAFVKSGVHFCQAIPYYMDDLPQIDYRRLTPTCPPVKPYPPGREPPIERKYLYFERKFDQCLRFSERKYESLARQVAQRQTNLTWPLLFDFMLNADFSGSLERYDSLFEPWAECPSPYPCPIPAPPGGFGNETDIDDEPNAARPAGWAWANRKVKRKKVVRMSASHLRRLAGKG